MRRREFIALATGAAAWPVLARGQQAKMPVIGVLHSGSPASYQLLISALRDGLKDSGYVEGENLSIEYRWANGLFERLPALADELVQRGVKAIVALGGSVAPLAAQKATSSIPIIFSSGQVDPVQSGLVASLSRPGGNITGVSTLSGELQAKRLALFHELLPRAQSIAFLTNQNNPAIQTQSADFAAAARALGLSMVSYFPTTPAELETIFARMREQRIDAVFVAMDLSLLNQIVAIAERFAIPASYQSREFVAAGGLMSYAASFADAYRLAGRYTGRVLRGEIPANLPVIQSAKFELVINRKTATTLGIAIPPQMIALADEVIE